MSEKKQQQQILEAQNDSMLEESENNQELKHFSHSDTKHKIDRNTYQDQMEINLKSLSLGKIKLKDNKEWLNQQNCQVCYQQFSKLKMLGEHHCRKCGKSVCELCSQKKINDNRVCDKCFIKVNHRKLSKEIKQFDEKINELKQKIQLQQEDEKKIDQELDELTTKEQTDIDGQQQNLLYLEENLKKTNDELQRNKEINQSLKKALQTDEQILKKKQNEIDQCHQQIQYLENEIQTKNQCQQLEEMHLKQFQEKEMELQQIKSQIIKEGSYINNSKPPSKIKDKEPSYISNQQQQQQQQQQQVITNNESQQKQFQEIQQYRKSYQLSHQGPMESIVEEKSEYQNENGENENGENEDQTKKKKRSKKK